MKADLLNKIVETLCEVGIFEKENDKLKPRSNEVWKLASDAIGNKISPETLNVYARLDRYNILTQVKKNCGIVENIVSSVNSSLTSSNDSQANDPTFIINDVSKNGSLTKLCFTLYLEEKLWKTMAPSEVDGYKSLRGPWTDIIAKRCFEEKKLPCAYIFKRAKISNGLESAWLKITGSCKECKSPFEAHCLNEPITGTGVAIAVTVLDTREIPHTQKRPLKGLMRINVGKEMIFKKALVWRKEASKDMVFGDPEPAYLPSSNVLRKVRHEALNRHLGIEKGLDVIDSLLHMKYNGEFAGYIKEIGLDEFYCIYCSEMQIIIYKNTIKKIKKVVIDATGGVALPIRKVNGQIKHIFLYQMAMEGEDKTIPVYQMLSARHTTIAITSWLSTFLTLANHIPEEVVCDFSLALLNAISLSFNDRRLQTYITDCFLWILGEELQHPLRTYIRLDLNHLIKMMCRKKVFNGRPGKLKDFYIRCIGVMTICETLNDFEKMLLAVFIVALSECDGQNEIGEDIISQQKEDYLFERIKTFSFENQNNENTEWEPVDDEPSEVDDNIRKYVENLKSRAEAEAINCKEHQRPNAYYLPEIVNPLLKLALFFPMWTNVMKNNFSSQYYVATSSIIEEYFKDIKHFDLGNYSGPIRADKFIVTHLRSIEATCKFERAAAKRKSKSDMIASNVEVKKKEFGVRRFENVKKSSKPN